jgi:hypothetical protein
VPGVNRQSWCLAIGLLFGTALPAAAQQAPQPPSTDPDGTYAFIFENDTFSGRDRYYTNGFLFAWRSPSYNPPEWLGRMTEGRGLIFPGGTTRWGVGFGQKAWTPEDTLLRDPPRDDRPYAAWLYGSVSLTSYNATEMGILELQVGVVGPAALGEQVQNNAHDLINIDRALGWDTQLKDELGVNLVAARQWRLNRPTGWDGISVGLVPSLAGSLGNVSTYAGAGLMLRFGTELEADFGPPRVRPVSTGSVFHQPPDNPSDDWRWYVFGAVEGRAVLRDISLDGNTWRDSRSVDRETFVRDYSLGLAVFAGSARVAATYTVRSKEFSTQAEVAQFGALSIAVRF